MVEVEWKPVPTFPSYAMNSDGEIKNVRTGKLIAPYMQNGYVYVSLFRSGRRYGRSLASVYSTVYPPRREAEVLSDWVDIPGFEHYQVSRDGNVRRKTTKRPLKIGTGSRKSVNLHRDGRTYRYSIESILRLVGY